MPKAYTEEEKKQIKERLKEEALACMSQYGIRKTTVDEIVKRVNIPKGTFYLFYGSKEMLLFDALNDIDYKIHAMILKEMEHLGNCFNVDNLTDLFFNIYKFADRNIPRCIMVGSEMEVLFRKLPKEALAEHFSYDDKNMELVMQLIPQAKEKNIEYFSGAFRAIFMSMMYKKEIGEKIYDEVLRILIRGVVRELLL